MHRRREIGDVGVDDDNGYAGVHRLLQRGVAGRGEGEQGVDPRLAEPFQPADVERLVARVMERGAPAA